MGEHHDHHDHHGHAHQHGRGHSHGHGHHHHHHAGQNLAIAFFLNFSFAIIEFVGGMWTGSVAIQSDAVHDFGDSLSLGFAYVMEKLSHRKSTSSFSYGFRRFSLLAALINAAVLVGGSIYVLTKAIPLLSNPTHPAVSGMIGLAILGIAVNGFAAWRVSRGGTMNERVITWHLMEDVLGWIVILIGSCVMYFVDAPIIDPILSIAFTMFILWNVIKSLKSTMKLFLQATPDQIDLATTRTGLLNIPGVLGIHDFHMWSLDGQSHVATLHAVISDGSTLNDFQRIKEAIHSSLQKLGNIHVTVELDKESEECSKRDCVT